MSTTTSSTPAPRYPLDWLRGIAALVVVTFHAYQHNRSGPDAAWPWTGVKHQLMLGSDAMVDLFFVLSGLVLWLPIARAAERGETDRPGRVLLYKRMARLLPLYWTVVLVVWSVSNPVFPGQHWGDLLTHLTFTQVYSDQYIFWTDGPAWSLAVEFHFYVVMALAVPLVHAGVRRAATRNGRLAVAAVLPALCVAVGLGYLLWSTVLTTQDPENWSVWFSPLSRATDFGLGMSLALLGAAGIRLDRRSRAGLAVAGLALLVALVLVRRTDTVGEWWHPAYSLAAVIGLASIVLHDGPWPGVLSWRPLVQVGLLGYGVYLIHEPVMRVMTWAGMFPEPRPGAGFLWTAVLVVVPTLLLARLSSQTVERAGARLVAGLDRTGAPRDYYEHLSERDHARQ